MAEPARINENDLMRKLVGAKKVMNKVDGNSFTTGNIDRTHPKRVHLVQIQHPLTLTRSETLNYQRQYKKQ